MERVRRAGLGGPRQRWLPDRTVRGDLSLALHRAIACRLVDDPDRVVGKARANLALLRRVHADGSVDRWLDEWEALLDGPRDRLLAVLLDPGQHARDLRQSTPFAGVLPPAERWAAIRATRDGGSPCAAGTSST